MFSALVRRLYLPHDKSTDLSWGSSLPKHFYDSKSGKPLPKNRQARKNEYDTCGETATRKTLQRESHRQEKYSKKNCPKLHVSTYIVCKRWLQLGSQSHLELPTWKATYDCQLFIHLCRQNTTDSKMSSP